MIAFLTSLNAHSVALEGSQTCLYIIGTDVNTKTLINNSQVLTGSYSNFFHVYDLKDENDIILQADKSAFKAKRAGSTKNKAPGSRKLTRMEEYLNVDALDFSKKIIHASWHPREKTVALAATNNLFLFQG